MVLIYFFYCRVLAPAEDQQLDMLDLMTIHSRLPTWDQLTELMDTEAIHPLMVILWYNQNPVVNRILYFK